ncbi:RNA-directed DNA polymerase, eukaryota [Tanacetum coccineum]
MEARDSLQKSKIKWAIEGDENSKFFHGINKKRSQLSICGVFVDGNWSTEPSVVKDAFKNHFAAHFKQPVQGRLKLNISFTNWLSSEQVVDMDRSVSRDEIRMAVWNCGENKSPRPDGYTFEFFRKYWRFVEPDFCAAVKHFFENGSFPKGCNSSFIALILKVTDAKFVTDFRPISLIGCIYKVVTKVLAIRLATVISDLVSDTQSAFVANRQILDGPFLLNELLTWCKKKKKQVMFFKVDFAKAYDSVRWDYLLDVLQEFGFSPNWCRWIRGTFSSAMASILVNGSPTSEFPFFYGLKQGDPLSPYLFILIMESLHISFSRASNDGLFKGEWSDSNLKNIVKILKCFFLVSGLKINIHKSQVLGVGVPRNLVTQAASMIGCAIMQKPFRYLGLKVGDFMSRKTAWVDTVHKLWSRLSNWKVKTSIGVLKKMEAIRSKFFNGADISDRKITWASSDKVLASNKNGGLGVSSFHALNRALLLKWVWHFISQDGSLWFRVIQAMYGSSFDLHSVNQLSIWCSILREVHLLKSKGFEFITHCKKRVGDGHSTRFWYDNWISDQSLRDTFPRLFALETDKEATVAAKLGASSTDVSFRRAVRDGAERQQWSNLNSLYYATRWVKYIPIKINVFAWRVRLDCLPTRSNLIRRGVILDSALCPLCDSTVEDIHHVLFGCDNAQIVFRRICRWWDLDWYDLASFSDWYAWFSAIRFSSSLKLLLEGVFYVAWWHLWVFRNRSIFDAAPPRRSVIFDDIVSRSFNWCSSRFSSNEITSSEEYTCVVSIKDGCPIMTHSYCDKVIDCHPIPRSMVASTPSVVNHPLVYAAEYPDDSKFEECLKRFLFMPCKMSKNRNGDFEDKIGLDNVVKATNEKKDNKKYKP